MGGDLNTIFVESKTCGYRQEYQCPAVKKKDLYVKADPENYSYGRALYGVVVSC